MNIQVPRDAVSCTRGHPSSGCSVRGNACCRGRGSTQSRDLASEEPPSPKVRSSLKFCRHSFRVKQRWWCGSGSLDLANGMHLSTTSLSPMRGQSLGNGVLTGTDSLAERRAIASPSRSSVSGPLLFSYTANVLQELMTRSPNRRRLARASRTRTSSSTRPGRSTGSASAHSRRTPCGDCWHL